MLYSHIEDKSFQPQLFYGNNKGFQIPTAGRHKLHNSWDSTCHIFSSQYLCNHVKNSSPTSPKWCESSGKLFINSSLPSPGWHILTVPEKPSEYLCGAQYLLAAHKFLLKRLACRLLLYNSSVTNSSHQLACLSERGTPRSSGWSGINTNVLPTWNSVCFLWRILQYSSKNKNQAKIQTLVQEISYLIFLQSHCGKTDISSKLYWESSLFTHRRMKLYALQIVNSKCFK